MQQTLEEFRHLLYSEAGIHWYLNKVDGCRKHVAQLLNVQDPSAIAFVPNASTANFLVLSFQPWGKGDIVITTTHENPSIHRELQALARYGVELRLVQPDSPSRLISTIQEAIRTDRVKALVLSHVSHVDGRIFPIAEIGALAQKNNILFIVDGAQAVGHIPVDLEHLLYDIYFFPGHKWCFGPLGTGALAMHPHFLELNPTFGSQCLEQGKSPVTRFEIGTHNIGLIAGLAKACERKVKEGLRPKALDGLQNSVGSWATKRVDIQRMGWEGPHAPGIFTIRGLSLETHMGLVENLHKQWNIVAKPFVDYPKDGVPAVRLSWAQASDKEQVLYALEKISEHLNRA